MHVSTYFSVDGKKRYEEAISISPNLSQELILLLAYDFFKEYDLPEMVVGMLNNPLYIAVIGSVFFLHKRLFQAVRIQLLHPGCQGFGLLPGIGEQHFPIGLLAYGRVVKTIAVPGIQGPAFQHTQDRRDEIPYMVNQAYDGIEPIDPANSLLPADVLQLGLQAGVSPVVSKKYLPNLLCNLYLYFHYMDLSTGATVSRHFGNGRVEMPWLN